MAYEGILRKIYQNNSSVVLKLGLRNAQRLHEAMGSPLDSLETIHVTGTNGKGSVTWKIARALQFGGYRTGLFNSPHISSYRERMRVLLPESHGISDDENDNEFNLHADINDRFVEPDEVVDILERAFQVAKAEDISASFFELTTIATFCFFAQQKVDVAVVEVGLGGRLDSTNIIKDPLGDTIEQIAHEKAGIMKPGSPVIVGPRAPQQLLRQRARDISAGPYVEVDGSDSAFFDDDNRAVANAVLRCLPAHRQVSEAALRKGLRTRPPCRFQSVRWMDADLLLDVAHNEAGMSRLLEAIDLHHPDRPLRVVLGLYDIPGGSKVKGCLGLLQRHGVGPDRARFVQANVERSTSVKELQKVLPAPASDSFAEALTIAAREAREENGLLVVCGSIYMMHEVRVALGSSVLESQILVDPVDKP